MVDKLRAGLLMVVAACSSSPAIEEPLPPGPNGWAIEVDMSAQERFVPLGTPTWTIGGHARSSEPLAGVDVAGLACTLDGGDFSSEVSVLPGITVVPIVARDAAGHERKAHRSLLSSAFLPEGELNERLMTLALSDLVLDGINAQITSGLGDVDLAAQIMAQPTLSQDENCTIRPVSASQGAVVAELVRRNDTELWLHFKLSNLLIVFDGECNATVLPVPVEGRIGGTIELYSQLTADAPVEGDTCVSSFTHTPPDVTVTGWIYEVGSPNILYDALVKSQAPSSEEARQQVITQVGTEADAGLTAQLSNVDLLRVTQSVDGLGPTPIDMNMCLAALGPEHGKLVIRMAGSVTGTGTDPAIHEGPGAPMRAQSAPVTADSELVLDTGLVSQLMYQAWRDGAFSRSEPGVVPLDLLGLLVPELFEDYPGVTHGDVTIDAELPPVIRSTPDIAGADMRVELADLMMTVSIGGERILKFNVHLVLDLDLASGDGMKPRVVSQTSEVILLEEKYDHPDNGLETAIQLGLAMATGDLFGGSGGGAVPVPEVIPGLGRITDITADADSRYLHFKLEPL